MTLNTYLLGNIVCRVSEALSSGVPQWQSPGLALLPVELPEAPQGWDVFWPKPRQPTDYPGLAVMQDQAFSGCPWWSPGTEPHSRRWHRPARPLEA